MCAINKKTFLSIVFLDVVSNSIYTLKPVGHQSTNWIVRLLFIEAMAPLTSLGTTSPRYSRQTAMYFPLRGSHFLIQRKREEINFLVLVNWATLWVVLPWPFGCWARNKRTWFQRRLIVRDRPFRPTAWGRKSPTENESSGKAPNWSKKQIKLI